jgi:hypothetical protein
VLLASVTVQPQKQAILNVSKLHGTTAVFVLVHYMVELFERERSGDSDFQVWDECVPSMRQLWQLLSPGFR